MFFSHQPLARKTPMDEICDEVLNPKVPMALSSNLIDDVRHLMHARPESSLKMGYPLDLPNVLLYFQIIVTLPNELRTKLNLNSSPSGRSTAQNARLDASSLSGPQGSKDCFQDPQNFVLSEYLQLLDVQEMSRGAEILPQDATLKVSFAALIGDGAPLPMALRLSSDLTGGVVIVDEFKVKLLYDDVHRLLIKLNEARKSKLVDDLNILQVRKRQAKPEAVTLPNQNYSDIGEMEQFMDCSAMKFNTSPVFWAIAALVCLPGVSGQTNKPTVPCNATVASNATAVEPKVADLVALIRALEGITSWGSFFRITVFLLVLLGLYHLLLFSKAISAEAGKYCGKKWFNTDKIGKGSASTTTSTSKWRFRLPFRAVP